MNISQSVSSTIGAVKFGFLGPTDIKSLSVKRITNPLALDTQLYPIAGGLHDLALGAFLDNPCATCYADISSCPGHCGHIELPVPVYNCTFMDQAYRLLRAQCLYCHRLRLSRTTVKLYCCKLKLLRYGLLREAAAIDEFVAGMENPDQEDLDVAGEDFDIGEKRDSDDVAAKLDKYVKDSIRRARRKGSDTELATSRSEVAASFRKKVVGEFMADIIKSKRCKNCDGISPGWRKNKYTSVFRKPLAEKEHKHNLKHRAQAVNPVVALERLQRRVEQIEQKKAEARAARKRQESLIDEGVADLDDPSSGEDIHLLDAHLDEHIVDEEYELEPEVEAETEEEDDNVSESGHGNIIAGEAASSRSKKRKSDDKTTQTFVNASEIHASLVHLFEVESEVFSLLYGSSGSEDKLQKPSADMFFIRNLLIPPNKYRKEQKTGPDEISESPDNSGYRAILYLCETIFQIRREIEGLAPSDSGRRLRNYDDLQTSWLQLQDAVNSLIDRDRNPAGGLAAARAPEGIKQKLEKKEGMFRMNIMGKRVNFAARSVISPDPNIETNEIGIPPVFAIKLTYPEPVTQHSFEDLKQAVINGPYKWPGAVSVEYENGQVVNLKNQSVEDRIGIANRLLAPSTTGQRGAVNKKVHRHLNNGDIVIMNRQPTLHKPSMMCHRARVLQGEKTIRMHYANTKTYNADFDGDEMNMHFPQNEIARAEALQIADTDHQYLSGTAGEPLRGLIQDHISISVLLTSKDTFYSRENYQQLLHACLRPDRGQTCSDRILTVEPMVIKPCELWTGKQVISTILLNIKPESHQSLTLTSKSTTPANRWGENLEEAQVLVQDGELCTGILDKKQIGTSAGGLVHMIYEAYGHTVAGQFMSILGRLLTRMLNMHAFSCGVEDLVLTDEGEAARAGKLRQADALGLAVAMKYVALDPQNASGSNDPELLQRLEAALRDDERQAGLDTITNNTSNGLSSEITKACLPNGLIKPFPKNQMQAMTTSGAKGSGVNANLISCNLGQQTLEGRRVPVMVSGKTLPAFRPFETNIRAGGYIVDRFLTGVRPQEYYFHTMAGREGLIDTAVKTSRSGYLQRCIIKGMEGLKAEYDTSIRDSDGTMIQALYGEDGVDVTKQRGLTNFKFIAQNHLSLFASLNIGEDIGRIRSEEAKEWNKKAWREIRKRQDIAAMDPATSQFAPSTHVGSTSEKFYVAAKKYMDDNPDKLLKNKKEGINYGINKSTYESMLNLNYIKSLIQPGEAIGVVAGQSIGEPSTQMTLNTFHLAGHAAKNVTLGIPRLREILMTASMHAKTPTMALQLLDEISAEAGINFAKGISRLPLAAVMDEIQVTEHIGSGMYAESRKYRVQLNLYPSEEYCDTYAITVADVARTIESSFIPNLLKMAKAELRKRGHERSLKDAANTDAVPEIGRSAGRVREEAARAEEENEGGDSDLDEEGDDDATNAKQRSNMDEGTTYEDPDEDDAEIEKLGEREASPDIASDSEDSTYGGTVRDAEDNAENGNGAKENSSKSLSAAAQERQERVIAKHDALSTFHFDDYTGCSCTMVFEFALSSPKILFLPLAERAARQALIQFIPGIGACTYTTDEESTTIDPFSHAKATSKVPTVLTEGANLLAIRDYQHIINPHTISTNDIGSTLLVYGVEACRSNIISELRAVFGGHGIDVDPRHLTLIADYMTRNGGYQSFSRTGMRSKTDTFGKMSFETTIGFLREAVLEGEEEDLSSPSARITIGKVGKMGTGAFDVLMPVTQAVAVN